MMNMTHHTGILLFASLLACPALGNEPSEEGENVDSSETNAGFVFEASVTGSYSADADFDDGIGEFQFSEFGFGIKGRRQIGDSDMISLELSSGFLNYDITASGASVAGDVADIGAEFDGVTTLSLTGVYSHQLSGSGSWFIGGGVLWGAEDDADFGDSVDGMITGGYRYTHSDKLVIGLGVVVRTRLDDDVLIVPLPQITYQIDEYWSIESQGFGFKINYKSSDSLDYGISSEFASTTFRLDDSHAFASEGMVTHRRVPIGFYARYQPNDTVEISGRIGGLLMSELEILDTSGNDIANQDIDTGIIGSVNVSFKF